MHNLRPCQQVNSVWGDRCNCIQKINRLCQLIKRGNNSNVFLSKLHAYHCFGSTPAANSDHQLNLFGVASDHRLPDVGLDQCWTTCGSKEQNLSQSLSDLDVSRLGSAEPCGAIKQKFPNNADQFSEARLSGYVVGAICSGIGQEHAKASPESWNRYKI